MLCGGGGASAATGSGAALEALRSGVTHLAAPVPSVSAIGSQPRGCEEVSKLSRIEWNRVWGRR